MRKRDLRRRLPAIIFDEDEALTVSQKGTVVHALCRHLGMDPKTDQDRVFEVLLELADEKLVEVEGVTFKHVTAVRPTDALKARYGRPSPVRPEPAPASPPPAPFPVGVTPADIRPVAPKPAFEPADATEDQSVVPSRVHWDIAELPLPPKSKTAAILILLALASHGYHLRSSNVTGDIRNSYGLSGGNTTKLFSDSFAALETAGLLIRSLNGRRTVEALLDSKPSDDDLRWLTANLTQRLITADWLEAAPAAMELLNQLGGRPGDLAETPAPVVHQFGRRATDARDDGQPEAPVGDVPTATPPAILDPADVPTSRERDDASTIDPSGALYQAGRKLPTPDVETLATMLNAVLGGLRQLPRDKADLHIVNMKAYCTERGYDYAVTLHYLKELGFIRSDRHNDGRYRWFVKDSGRVSPAALAKLNARGCVPREFVREPNPDARPDTSQRCYRTDGYGRAYGYTTVGSEVTVRKIGEPVVPSPPDDSMDPRDEPPAVAEVASSAATAPVFSDETAVAPPEAASADTLATPEASTPSEPVMSTTPAPATDALSDDERAARIIGALYARTTELKGQLEAANGQIGALEDRNRQLAADLAAAHAASASLEERLAAETKRRSLSDQLAGLNGLDLTVIEAELFNPRP